MLPNFTCLVPEGTGQEAGVKHFEVYIHRWNLDEEITACNVCAR